MIDSPMMTPDNNIQFVNNGSLIKNPKHTKTPPPPKWGDDLDQDQNAGEPFYDPDKDPARDSRTLFLLDSTKTRRNMYIKERLKERNINDDTNKTIIIKDSSPKQNIKAKVEKVPKFRIVPKSHLIPYDAGLNNLKMKESNQKQNVVQLNARHNRSIDIAPTVSERVSTSTKSKGLVEQMMRPKAIEKQLALAQKHLLI